MGPVFSVLISLLLVGHGYRKKSLSVSGAVSAFATGVGVMYNEWAVFPVVMLVFYFTGSQLTKYKAERKKQLDEEYQDGGQRNAAQVLCNALWGTLIAVFHEYKFGGGQITCLFQNAFATKLLLLYIGHYACCNGDTWASEIGVLNKGPPRLITTLKEVPPGTNGGVSLLGLAASFFGGSVIGISSVLTIGLSGGCDRWMWELIPIASFAGLLGSLIDSLLGATIQKTLYNKKSNRITSRLDKDVKVVSGLDLLDNNQVNFVSSFITSCLTAFITIDVLGVL